MGQNSDGAGAKFHIHFFVTNGESQLTGGRGAGREKAKTPLTDGREYTKMSIMGPLLLSAIVIVGTEHEL